MTTGEYRDRLFAQLQGYDPDEVGSVVDYYTELIEDAENPQEQMTRLGTPEQLAYKIKQENGWLPQNGYGQGNYQQFNYTNTGYAPPPQSRFTAGRILALILTFPFWITGYALIISLFAVALSFAVIFPAATVAAVMSMVHFLGVSMPYAAEMLFIAILCGGVTLLLLRPIRALFKGIAGLAKEFSLFLFAPGAVRGGPRPIPKPVSKLAIVMGVLMTVVGLTGAAGLENHNRKNIDTYIKDMGLETVEQDLSDDLSKLNIDMSTGNIEIRSTSDSKGRIVCSNVKPEKLQIEGSDDLSVKYSYSSASKIASFKFGFEEQFTLKTTPSVTVYLPEKSYEELVLGSDLGDVKCEGITADNIRLNISCGESNVEKCTIDTLEIDNDLGATKLNSNTINNYVKIDASCGEIKVDQLVSAGTAEISSSLGEVDIKNAEFEILNLSSDCGDFDMSGSSISKAADISIDLGSADIKLVGSGYNVKATCDLGEAKVNGSDASKADQGTIPVTVHCDTGDIDITTD